MDRDASDDRGIHDDEEAAENTCSGHDRATSGLGGEGYMRHTPKESARTDIEGVQKDVAQRRELEWMESETDTTFLESPKLRSSFETVSWWLSILLEKLLVRF